MATSLDLKNILSQLDESNIPKLRAILDDFYPQDIAEQFSSLTDEESQTLFDILSYEQGAAVFVELEQSDILKVLSYLSNEQIIRFANKMDLDDAADIIGLLDDERMMKILEKIQEPYELKELLSYEPDTCGGKMSPHFMSIRGDLKIRAALRYVRLKSKEIRNQLVYIYVTKKFGELAGVISLRDLFLASDEDSVSEHMNDEVISVNVGDDQELAAELISKYHFLALPVTNENKQLVGIITIDDAVDVIEEEATQDIYQSSGINVDSSKGGVSATGSFAGMYLGAYQARTPWLIITLVGQFFAALIIASYENTISSIPIAISFMPLLSGMSGNIGNQSMTIIVRGISIGDIDIKNADKVLLQEIFVSVAIGITCALITGSVSFYTYHNAFLSMLIAASLIASMALAVALGASIPMLFKKLGFDPATASGPLITTLIDVASFFIYLTMITKFVNVLI